MINDICFYFLLFVIYSFIGWVVEVIDQRIEIGKFVNRGFLVGPVCPIYGVAGLLMIFLLTKYMNSPLILFVVAIFICSILEYFTSYFMEKIFKARWWDYSDKKLNINGRICVETMIPFGFLAMVVLYLFNPFITSKIRMIPQNVFYVISIVLFLIYMVDLIVSLDIIVKIKSTFKTVERDSTEEITSKVKDMLFKKNWLFRRIFKAFPNIKNQKERLIGMQKLIENEIKSLNGKIANTIRRGK